MAFDPELATRAYLATLNGAARARSDAYFEGGYWLILWNALVVIAGNWAILRFGLAAKLSGWATRTTRFKWLRSFLFAAPYILLFTLITLPWTLYTDFFREHQYGLSTQDFPAWGGDFLKDLAISVLIGSLLFIGIHAAIRRAPRSWWAWGTALTIVGLTVGVALAPIFIEPLFNTYTPMPASPLQERVLSMARANGVPATHVYVVDASRQTTRISANVAGIGATTRVALNDNLLKQPDDEVRAVLGHELGHYVLNHIWKFIVFQAIIAGLAFWVTAKSVPWLLARYGAEWGVTEMSDPAVLPVGLIVLTLIGFVLTPIENTIVRTQEMEADRFGLNAARAPDAFAVTAMKLSQYRKIEPSAFEEAVFFDHPSGRTRVETSMRWKAEHLGEPDVR